MYRSSVYHFTTTQHKRKVLSVHTACQGLETDKCVTLCDMLLTWERLPEPQPDLDVVWLKCGHVIAHLS